MQTVQSQVRLLLNLIRVYTVCHSTKYFKKKLQYGIKVWNKVFELIRHLPYTDTGITGFDSKFNFLNAESKAKEQLVSILKSLV